MLNFLEMKNVDISHRTEIVDEIFRKCDQDHNGYIDLDEFV
jgi:Ca2+-binding EF-hand superfamily protein